MLGLNRAGSQLLLLSMLLIASPAVAQDGLDKGPTSKPTRHAAVNAPFIIGGTPAGPNDNPFQVGLLLKSEPSNGSAFSCSGSLIAPDLIVTAAHCGYYPQAVDKGWVPRPPSELQVLVGTRSLLVGGERVDVISVTRHPNYEPAGSNKDDYDVAVWKLSRRVENIPLARLAVSDGVPGSALLATGWGLKENDKRPADLLKVSLPLGSREDCEKQNSKFTPRMFCTSTAIRGICPGDFWRSRNAGCRQHDADRNFQLHPLPPLR